MPGVNDESLSHITPAFRSDVAALPAPLRRLLDDELAAGNTITSVGHHHPAPLTGAFVMLARPITTRPRQHADELRFHDRNSSLYRGEFSDAQRHFFILEAPGPPPEEPDMDAIRAGSGGGSARVAPPVPKPAEATSPVARFDRSRVMDYEKWHDGIGYDLNALREMTDAERTVAERALIPPSGWRDVEALAAIDSEQARDALRRAATRGSNEVRLAVSQYAAALLDEDGRTSSLVRALTTGQLLDGLSAALDQAEAFHPPAVLNALWRGLLERPGDVAYTFAATLSVIYGKSDSSADWSLRPLFLRFNTADRTGRLVALHELAQLLGVAPDIADLAPG